jgi:hypothetical protein
MKWARKGWSDMGMSEHESAGPLRVCVNVDDCYDPFSAGTLTCIKTIEMIVESILPPYPNNLQ